MSYLLELKNTLKFRNSMDWKKINEDKVITHLKYLSQFHSDKCNINVLFFLGANGYIVEYPKRFKGWRLTSLGESVIKELMGN